jgi:hypothetical protein
MLLGNHVKGTALPQCHCERCASSAAASHGDALWINRLRELTAESSAPPSFESVPISWPLEVTNTCKVAVATVLVASTLSLRLPASYSARVIATESGHPEP